MGTSTKSRTRIARSSDHRSPELRQRLRIEWALNQQGTWIDPADD